MTIDDDGLNENDFSFDDLSEEEESQAVVKPDKIYYGGYT